MQLHVTGKYGSQQHLLVVDVFLCVFFAAANNICVGLIAQSGDILESLSGEAKNGLSQNLTNGCSGVTFWRGKKWPFPESDQWLLSIIFVLSNLKVRYY